MAGRHVPQVGLYNLNSQNAAGAYVTSALHDLNTVDSRNGDIEGLGDADRDTAGGDSLDNEEDESNSVEDGVPGSYGNSMALQPIGQDSVHLHLQGQETARPPYGAISLSDVNPMETAKARFLNLLIDHFITQHTIPAMDSPEMMYNNSNSKEKSRKRKPRENQWEGDPNYLLPLTFVANLYETLISEINQRLATVEHIPEKTMMVALEAAGGLYRRLIRKYPKSGANTTFKRREMASALEARNKFPHLVTGEEKRVRFVVVHGLELVERPDTLSPEDAEWFKRLTGRHEAAIERKDYNFFSARVKHRRSLGGSLGSIPSMPSPYVSGEALQALSAPGHGHLRPPHFGGGETVNVAVRSPQFGMVESSANEPQSPTRLASGVQHTPPPHPGLVPIAPRPQGTQLLGALPHLGTHTMHTPHVSSHGGAHQSQASQKRENRVLALGVNPTPGPAKYCDECGAQYLREASKFCSECGTKRLGICTVSSNM